MSGWLKMKSNKTFINELFSLEELFLRLPSVSHQHAPGSEVYDLMKQIARREVEKLFFKQNVEVKEFKPFGNLIFPYYEMGAANSLNLFDFDELIIFSFYWLNRKRYSRVLDIGANLGLHSIVLSKCGYEVHAYEPDSQHFEILQKNLELNHCSNVRAYNEAVSNRSGIAEFVRVLGNTPSSHIAGSRLNPYGELKRFSVKVENIESLINWADLIKLDAEGHEREILLATHREHWLNTDALVEVGSKDNAVSIFKHFKALRIKLFSQKNNWKQVCDIDDVPTSYREGTLFVTSKDRMPWIRNQNIFPKERKVNEAF